MLNHKITAFNNLDTPLTDRISKGDVKTYKLDFSPWAEDNSVTLNAATWTVEKGQATVSGNTLTSNVAQANITAANEGKSLIKVSATNGTITKVFWLDIYAYDPDAVITDYV